VQQQNIAKTQNLTSLPTRIVSFLEVMTTSLILSAGFCRPVAVERGLAGELARD
jgi:hypothetical protein